MADKHNGLVLVVDDEPLITRTLSAHLKREGYATIVARTVREATQAMTAELPSLVLLDLQLPDGHGLDVLPRFRAQWPETPVIVMTGHASIPDAVRAMAMDASTYVTKPLQFDALTLEIRQALKNNRLAQVAADEQRRNSEQFSLDGLVARSAAMQQVIEQARVVAASRATNVLLLGESGTGKGILANAIHYASTRAAHPMRKVTCSAIPEALLEDELFGHEKGAFTDAKERRRGAFEIADQGTVFLDEIGDMPLALQAKLLGIVEDRDFSRIGGTRRIKADVRIIAATHRDLDQAVEEGHFRADLRYRLDVVQIVLPALRDRPEDIVPLAESFVKQFNREFGRTVDGIDPDAAQRLEAGEWRGNVRELRNVIERAMLFSSGSILTSEHLSRDASYRPRNVKGAQGSRRFILPPEGIQITEIEQDLVRQAMKRCNNNQSRAAALLGLSRDQIRYRLDKMGLLKNKKRPPAVPDDEDDDEATASPA